MNEKQMHTESDINTELLRELVSQQKKTGSRTMVLMIVAIVIAVVLVVSAVVVIPSVVTTLNSTTELIQEADESLSTVNELVNSETGSMADIIEKINNVDFDSLNQSIQSLSDILSPLASALGVFK